MQLLTRKEAPMSKSVEITAPLKTIQHTTDYERFTTITGNRRVSEGHVNLLMNSFRSNPLLIELRPILVNESMEVLDGQHRLEALKRLNLPVPYQILPGGDLQTIQVLNSTQLVWKLVDFIKSFASTGNEDYATLVGYITRYHFNVRLMVRILGQPDTRAWNVDRMVKTGDFVLREDIEEADAFLSHYQEVRVESPMTMIGKGEYLAEAMFRLWTTEGYDPQRMKGKMVQRPIMPQPTRLTYIKELEAVYNYNAKASGYLRFI